MKIIGSGKQLVAVERWWTGMKVTCPNCGCVFELDETDSAMFATASTFGVNCPNYLGNCRTFIEINRDGTIAGAQQVKPASACASGEAIETGLANLALS